MMSGQPQVVTLRSAPEINEPIADERLRGRRGTLGMVLQVFEDRY